MPLFKKNDYLIVKNWLDEKFSVTVNKDVSECGDFFFDNLVWSSAKENDDDGDDSGSVTNGVVVGTISKTSDSVFLFVCRDHWLTYTKL